jgi:sortase A
MNKIFRTLFVVLFVVATGFALVGAVMYRERQARDTTNETVAVTAQAEAVETEQLFAPARKTLSGAPERPVMAPKLKTGQRMAVLRLPGQEPILIKQGTNDMNRETELLNTGSAVHYVDSAKWFGPGVFAMSGHRTTYGAPFHDLDKMKAGDVATVVTRDGKYRYRYHSTKIVSPDDLWVINPSGKARYRSLADGGLVMTACHPKHSARQRIAVFWTLIDFTPAN